MGTSIIKGRLNEWKKFTTEEKERQTKEPPNWEALYEIKENYLPRKRVTAAPRAKIPVKTTKKLSLKAGTNAAIPTNKKYRTMNQVERALGVFILRSPRGC
jgi:hypothetical protein